MSCKRLGSTGHDWSIMPIGTRASFNNSRVDTMVDIENVVLWSTLSGANKAQLIQDCSGKKNNL